jgi:hemerythrin-like domain-containing protein
MSPQKKVDEQFLRLSMEHTLILDVIHDFHDVLSKPDAKESFHNIKRMTEAFEKDCRDHFNLEETVLFPAALACLSSLDSVDVVLLLQKEHGYLERDLDSLLDFLQNQPETTVTIPGDLQIQMQSFCTMLDKHAQIEMKEVFRLMDESRHCQKILKGFLIPG